MQHLISLVYLGLLGAEGCMMKLNFHKFKKYGFDDDSYTVIKEEDNPSDGTIYDYIIGAGGGVVAGRLAETKRYNVLLLEAGPFPPWELIVPYLDPVWRGRSSYDWLFETVPQRGLNNRTVFLAQGKMVGGTSSGNGFTVQRGNPRDYDRWAEITGDPSWNYSNLLKYFKRSENYQGSFPIDPDHGTSGRINVEEVGDKPFAEEFVEAGRELGFPYKDHNSREQQSSFVVVEVTTRKGRRSTVYEGYILPAIKKGLNVLANAYVTKVNIDRDLMRAESVTFHRHGEVVTVRARKEIIISAGTIKTPQVLMLSGIGPADHLRSFGIEPLVDLPGVGKGLAEHFRTTLGPFLVPEGSSFVAARDLTKSAYMKYMLFGKSPLSSQGTSAVGLWSTDGNHNWPNVFLSQAIVPAIIGGKEVDSVSVRSIVMRTLSRGSVSLQSDDPYAPPRLDPNYHDDPADKDAAIKSARFAMEFYENTTAFRALAPRWVNLDAKSCHGFNSRHRNDDFLNCLILNTGGPSHHLGSSARMAADNDPMGVVDTKLRVRGVSGLRIADGSIMPDTVNVNTHTACIMIGEKAADLILKDR